MSALAPADLLEALDVLDFTPDCEFFKPFASREGLAELVAVCRRCGGSQFACGPHVEYSRLVTADPSIGTQCGRCRCIADSFDALFMVTPVRGLL